MNPIRRPILAGACGLALLCAPMLSAAVTFTLGTTNSDKEYSVQAMQRFADAIRQRSGGSLDMKIISGGALGGDKDLLQQLGLNEIQLHVAGPVVVHHLVKEYQCMEAEYVYEDGEHGLRVWNGPLGQEVSEALQKKHGIRIVGVGHRGARHVTSNKPVRTPTDMEGIKIRVTNKLRQKVFAAYGANPVPMSIKEVYGALQTGTIDAQENPLGTIYGQKFYEVQKDVNLTGHVWSYFVVSANDKFYQGLSAPERAIFDEEMANAMQWMDAAVLKSFDDMKQTLAAEGLEIVEPDVKAFRSIAQPIVAEYARESCRPGLLDDIAKQAK